jgi:HAMP domain-containing protein
MSLRARMILFVSLLLAGSVLVTTAILAAETRQSILAEQQESGRVLARVLSQTAAIVQDFPVEMESAIAEQMVIEATITAHFIAAAQAAGWTPDEINARLKEIVANTELSEFWITDQTGYASLRSEAGIEFTFSSDPEANPQAYEFFQLITGDRSVVIQPARPRDFDQRFFKYVGVGGVDGPRIVQVGYEATVVEALRERVSLNRLSAELVAGGDIQAIRLVDEGFETQVFQAGIGIPDRLTETDLASLKQVIQTGTSTAYLDENLLKVIEPVRARATNAATGAVMVYLPTDRLRAAILQQVLYSLFVAAGVLLVGVIGALLFSRVVTEPVSKLQKAADSVAQGRYQPALLAGVIPNHDEMGQLARVFDGMAREVSARDQRLNLLRVIIPMGVSLSVEKDFNRLLETIVVEAKKITRADAGSLYLRTPDDKLRFVILRNSSLKIYLGGTTGQEPTFKPLPMYLEDGRPNHHNLASYVALTGKSLALADAYQTTVFDLSGTRAFDAETGYRSQSFLTIPLKNTADEVIGVLQLINAQDAATGAVIPFNEDEVVDSLGLITSAALSAYIREEGLRQEISKLRIEIDLARQNKQVEDITESDYFQQLQAKAKKMREQRKE